MDFLINIIAVGWIMNVISFFLNIVVVNSLTRDIDWYSRKDNLVIFKYFSRNILIPYAQLGVTRPLHDDFAEWKKSHCRSDITDYVKFLAL